MLRVAFRPDPDLYPFTSRWLERPGGRVHYVDEGEGPPLLLLHGNPTWSFLYRRIVVELRDRFRCVAVDYPGFGLSDRPDGYGYTPAEHARAVGELVDVLGLEDWLVMGQDWGGPIGLRVAADRADRVRGLILGNTWFWPTERLAIRAFSKTLSTAPMAWLIRHRNFFVEQMLPAGTAKGLSDRVMEHYRRVQPPGGREGTAEFPRQLIVANPWLADLARDVAGRLHAKPALFPWGMRDFAFRPRDFLPRMRTTFADHEVVPLGGAGHFIQEDAPESIAAAIARRFGG